MSNFFWRTVAFGILWAIWQAGSSIYVLDSWPSAFTWLKIASAAAVAFVGGCLTYAKDPANALNGRPGMLKIIAIFVLFSALTGLSGCASQFGPMAMSPEQLKEWARVKDQQAGCIKGVYAGVTVVNTYWNVDKGVPQGKVSIKDDCTIVYEQVAP